MLFRVGRTFAVVVCAGAVAIEFAAAADIPYVQSPAPAYVPPTPSWAGFYLGGQLGYNFQYNRLVFGIEGSVSAADFDRSFASPYFPATDVWSSRLTWLTTVTGRVGYGFDNWLPYVKGGFAAGNVETSIQTNPFGVISQGSAVHSGWTLGGGVEFKVAPQFSLGVEFMHTDLGRSTDINGPQIVPGAPESYGVGLRSNSIMARFNYLFGR